jgi:hypothetical protein
VISVKPVVFLRNSEQPHPNLIRNQPTAAQANPSQVKSAADDRHGSNVGAFYKPIREGVHLAPGAQPQEWYPLYNYLAIPIEHKVVALRRRCRGCQSEEVHRPGQLQIAETPNLESPYA